MGGRQVLYTTVQTTYKQLKCLGTAATSACNYSEHNVVTAALLC